MKIELRESLYILRHENPELFVDLISEMVEELSDLFFKDIAQGWTSWPINVPVRRKLKGKTSTSVPGRTREEWTDLVLDNLLRVGGGTVPDLRKKKSANPGNPFTSVAGEVLGQMYGMRRRPDSVELTRVVLGLEKATFNDWARKASELPEPTVDRIKWAELAFEFAQLRFGHSLQRDPGIMRLLEASSDAVRRTKTAKSAEGYSKRSFLKAVLRQL